MIKVGYSYRAANGDRFTILVHKIIASSNGHNYIGENRKTGAITYFNLKGENSFKPEWNLECDPYRYIPVMTPSLLSNMEFKKKADIGSLSGPPIGYLRIEHNDPTTIVFINPESIEYD